MGYLASRARLFYTRRMLHYRNFSALICLVALSLTITALPVPARPYTPSADWEKDPAYYPQASHPSTGTSKKKSKSDKVILKGHVNYCVPKGTPIKLKLSMVPSTGLRLMDRDLDGNLHPAVEGQKITARTTEDIYVDDSKVIPQGTVFYGTVSKIHGPRRVYRPGHLEIKFDQLQLPDGKKFAFTAEADNFKKSTPRSKARGFGRLVSYAAGGAIVGAVVAYQLFGLQNTIQCHGYNVAGGAAAGALIATGYAVMKRGPRATLEPGDDLNLRIDTDLLMPMAVEPRAAKLPPSLDGLDVRVDKMKQVKDGLGNKLLRLDLFVDNNTERTLNSIDLFLEDTNGNRNPLSTEGDEQSEMMFSINPHSLTRKRVFFQLEWPKLNHKLVWLDRRTRKPLHVLELY